MPELNKIVCGDNSKGNTGIPDCPFDPALLEGIILTPQGFKITKTQITSTLLATLKAATHAARGARIFPILNFEDIEDKTEEPTYETFGYGTKKLVKENPYDFDITYLDGALCLSNQLRLFNTKKWSAFFVNNQGVLMGIKSADDLLAIPLETFFAKAVKIATGSTSSRFMFNVQFEKKYLNEQIGFVQTDFDIFDEVKGLLNVLLVQVTALASGKVTVQVVTSCGSQNLYDLYSTNLTQVSAWVVKNATTGNAITVTSVATNPTASAFELTLNTSDTDYPTSGNKLTIELSAPAVLSASPINMSGYENVNLLTETV